MKLLVLSEDAVKDEGLINTLSNIMRIKNVSSETVAAMTDGISAKEYLRESIRVLRRAQLGIMSCYFRKNLQLTQFRPTYAVLCAV